MSGNYPKLPDYVARRIRAMETRDARDRYVRDLRSAGWSIHSISYAAGLRPSRVQEILTDQVRRGTQPSGISIPRVPQVA